MQEIASEMLFRLRDALPEATIYWEKEPATRLKGSVLTAEHKHRKCTVQFDSRSDKKETFDEIVMDEVVDDFVEFFSRSLYAKEKFTRMV